MPPSQDDVVDAQYFLPIAEIAAFISPMRFAMMPHCFHGVDAATRGRRLHAPRYCAFAAIIMPLASPPPPPQSPFVTARCRRA